MADLLDHTTAHVIAVLLKDLGLGVLRGTAGMWPISVNSEESSPDEVITVFDTEARPDGRSQHGQVLTHQAVQIRIRGRDQRTAYVKAKAIAKKLDENVYHDTVAITPNSYCIQSFSRAAGIAYLGKESDTSQRRIFVLNGYVTIRQIS
jgi:hypothetical protein